MKDVDQSLEFQAQERMEGGVPVTTLPTDQILALSFQRCSGLPGRSPAPLSTEIMERAGLEGPALGALEQGPRGSFPGLREPIPPARPSLPPLLLGPEHPSVWWTAGRGSPQGPTEVAILSLLSWVYGFNHD